MEPTHKRYSELDGYRGLAAIAVVIYHAHFAHLVTFGRDASGGILAGLTLGNGDAGVSLFFVLSGFLIGLPFVRACLMQSTLPKFAAYIRRRAARIVPGYYAAVVIVFLLFGGERIDLLSHLSFTHIFREQSTFTLVRPGWSIAVEAFYYLALAGIAPLAFWLCARLESMHARAFFLANLIAAIWIASVAYKGWAVRAGIPVSAAIFVGPLARADAFVIGVALAVIAAYRMGRDNISPSAARKLRIGGLLIVLTAFLGRYLHPIAYTYFMTICALGFTALIGSSVLSSGQSWWDRMFAHPILRALGAISYGLYLWHGPILDNLLAHGLLIGTDPNAFARDIAILLLLSLVAASMSYLLIERPAIRLVHRYQTKLATRHPRAQHIENAPEFVGQSK